MVKMPLATREVESDRLAPVRLVRIQRVTAERHEIDKSERMSTCFGKENQNGVDTVERLEERWENSSFNDKRMSTWSGRCRGRSRSDGRR